MATPILVGVGAIAAAVVGRQLMRNAGKAAADQWVKGGFKAKMDRKEAIAILGLKYATFVLFYWDSLKFCFPGTARHSVTSSKTRIGKL